MDSIYKRAFSLISKYFLYGETDVGQIPFIPQKTVSCINNISHNTLHVSTPENTGIKSAYISDFLHTLEESERSNVHSVVIVSKGKMICNASAPGYNSSVWHLTHSMCKTLISLAIGMLIDDGKILLSNTLYDFFGKNVDGKLRNITIKNLLDMSANISFAELGSITTENWTSEFLSSELKAAVGSKFCYNSMNSYILGVIIKRISGYDPFDFLNERLFRPLGIINVFWEKSPEGISKSGWGLYISAQDMAKIALMLLAKGMYNGRRILSEEYISEATKVQIENPKEDSTYNYGLHLWVNRNERSYLLNGMFGQNVWICPENEMIIVCTSGNNELFQHSATLSIIARFFDPSVFSPLAGMKENKKDYNKLLATQKNFFSCRSFAEPIKPPSFIDRVKAFFRLKKIYSLPLEAYLLDGQTYDLQKNNFGILPTVVRFMQNNHSLGIKSLSFKVKSGKFFAVFDEYDSVYELKVGFFRHEETEINVHGEKYCVSVLGEFTKSEDRKKMLKLELLFPELPNTRKISFYFENPENVRLKFDESPGRNMIEHLLQSMKGALPKSLTLLSIIKPQFNLEVIQFKLLSAFSPEVTAKLHKSSEFLLSEKTVQKEEEQGSTVAEEPAGVK